MSFAALVGGGECGPSNALQGLSKRFDQDRGIQQDHFGPGQAGNSREAFRTHQPNPAETKLTQEAAAFYNASPITPAALPQSAFNLSALNASLAMVQQPHRQSSQPTAFGGNAGWAADFARMETSVVTPISSNAGDVFKADFEKSLSAGSTNPSAMQSLNPHIQTQPLPGMQLEMMQSPLTMHGPSMLAFQPTFASTLSPSMQYMQRMPIQTPIDTKAQEASWAAQFASIEKEQEKVDTIPSTVPDVVNAEDLAATAGLLLESVKNEQNPKFKNSAFLGLMRKVRDRETVVEGNDLVDAPVEMDIKGKGRADSPTTFMPTSVNTSLHDGPVVHQTHPVAFEQQSRSQTRRKSVHFDSPTTEEMNELFNHDPEVLKRHAESVVHGPSSSQEEEVADDELEEAEGNEYLRRGLNWHDLSAPSGVATAQTAEWGQLQDDWDAFEATATGVRPVAAYPFQANNPYVLGESSRTYHHSLHSAGGRMMHENVLEKEAAVQRDPTNAAAWFELGVKQQENEREDKAILALVRAVELDPTLAEAWLALAISQTNESNRSESYDAIEKWVEHNGNERYRSVVGKTGKGVSLPERHRELVDRLVTMARMAPEGEVDADVQVALAVLLNTSEEYEKAGDCFRTALAVRPNDALLYNRVGATLANGGQAEEALQYYYRALELNPSYIRARFNLGISCINLRMYNEAAQYILDALVLQDSDAPGDQGGSAVTSSALWDSLRTACLHLQRLDLTSLCESRDLSCFRTEFEALAVSS